MNKYPLENVLTLTKSLVNLYTDATVESSTKKVRDLMESGLTMALKMQDTLYQTMSEDGYYNVSNVSSTEIDKLYNKLEKDSCC